MFRAGRITSRKRGAGKTTVPVNRGTSRALPGRGSCIPGAGIGMDMRALIPGRDACRAFTRIAAHISGGEHRENTSGAAQEGFVDRPARAVLS
jgi:hypothetical protein